MSTDVVIDALFGPLAAVADEARWRMEDVPWQTFDRERATPALQGLAREMAFSEQATFSATQRFMQAMPDDVDFTQWLSVWFYEETRHPHVLMRWLSLAGQRFDTDFVVRGRVSAPFMKSRTGTLVTNVISEMAAAQSYLGLARAAPEPLLAALSERIAADEARHAASFFRYARRRLERAGDTERERLDAIKVLHFWLNESDNVTHPVNQMMQKTRTLQPEAGVQVDIPAFRARICATVGQLVDLPLRSPADVPPALTALATRVHSAA